MEMVKRMMERDRFARLVGLEVVRAGEGESVVQMRIEDRHLNALDMVQGGAIFTLGDFAFALACNSKNPPSVGLSVSIQFLRPGKSGVLTATARELSTNGKVGTYLVEITDDGGEVIASFQGLAFTKGAPRPEQA